jgi:amino acid adenylation domain-containing protein
MAKTDLDQLLELLAQDGWEGVRPIPKTHRSTPPPLSFAQEWIWFLDQLEGTRAYHLPRVQRLLGPLDETLFRRALAEIELRHESLRTTFEAVDGSGVQVVHAAGGLAAPLVDLTALREPDRRDEESRLSRALTRRPFELSRGPLFRCTLLRIAREHHVLHMVAHHIIADRWSLAVLRNDLGLVYRALLDGQLPSLAELPVRFADYAVWQREEVARELAGHLDFWRKELAGVAPLELPTDRPRPAQLSRRGGRLGAVVPAPVVEELQDLCRRAGVSLFMALLGALQVLLYRMTGEEDICVGAPIAGRDRPELEGMVGCFLNTVVLRSRLGGNPSFSEVLERVGEVCFGAFTHGAAPFQTVVQELKPGRHLNRLPFFDVVFVMLNTPATEPSFADLRIESVESPWETAEMDLGLYASQAGGGLNVNLEYSTDLFDDATGARLLGRYVRLLEAVAADPTRPIASLPLLDDRERVQLAAWNATSVAYRREGLLHRLVEEQAARTPTATAVELDGSSLTYRELDERANQLARGLALRGVGPDDVVGICMERSLELVVGLLGVLKAGGAYLPLDPEHPAASLAFMLEDARPPVILTQTHLEDRLPPSGARLLRLDPSWEALGDLPRGPLRTALSPSHLAYVIYTSGSTGRPKGVMSTHGGICNRLLWMQDTYRLGPDDRVLQKTPATFDVSVWEFFWPLLVGARLVLARPGGQRDPRYLMETIASRGITTLHFVPSMLRAFLDEPALEACKGLRRVICSGEALAREDVARFRARCGAALHNLYGPTEASVDVTSWDCSRTDVGPVPIGGPIANTQIHLLGPDLEPVPVGVRGELYIGGVGLARGYLARPDLTAARFVPDPLGEPGARLYRTGDLARRLPCGAVDYLGRIDHQVKLRGLRIELGEIEARLLEHPRVKTAVVVLRGEDSGDPRLVAYVVADAGGATPDELGEHLRDRLPGHMVPSLFLHLEALPLTTSGKVDRRALPSPDWDSLRGAVEHVDPRDQVERQVAEVWQRVLSVTSVGVFDNFFALGGHSLHALRVIAILRQEFEVALPLRSFWECPTVAESAILLLECMVAASSESLEQLIDGQEKVPGCDSGNLGEVP